MKPQFKCKALFQQSTSLNSAASMNNLRGQTTIRDFFATVEEHNNVEYHFLRLHAEALFMYKLKFFGFPVNDVPPNAMLPILWHGFTDMLRPSHPLNLNTFHNIMVQRNLSLPLLQRLTYKTQWTGERRLQFDNHNLAYIIDLLFSKQELVYAATQL